MASPNQQRNNNTDADDCRENNKGQLHKLTLTIPSMRESDYAADFSKGRLKIQLFVDS